VVSALKQDAKEFDNNASDRAAIAVVGAQNAIPLKVCVAEASLVYGFSVMRQIPQHSLLSTRVQIARSEDQQQMLPP